VALHAAEKNPVPAGPTDDPNVQKYQQAAMQYQQATNNANNAQESWHDAQNQADADQSVLALAKNKIDSGTATPAQQQGYTQMVEKTKTDEDAAEKAREIFDGANAQLSLTRTNAATSLAALAPSSGASANLSASRVSTPTVSTSSSVVDWSHAHRSTPVSLKLGTSNGVPIPTTPIKTTAAPVKVAATMAPQDLGACLATAAGHPIDSANLPTVEKIRAQLEDAEERIRGMVENQEKQDELGNEAAEQVNEAQNDAKKQAIELTADYVLHKAMAGVRSGVWESGRELGDLQKLASAETDPGKLAVLQSRIQQATMRQENPEACKGSPGEGQGPSRGIRAAARSSRMDEQAGRASKDYRSNGGHQAGGTGCALGEFREGGATVHALRGRRREVGQLSHRHQL
jgi:hypothetical protein